jgi:putative phage-type endonuclease
MEILQPTSGTIIKRFLKSNYNGKYNPSEYLLLLEDISNKLNNIDKNLIKKLLGKYTKIDNNKLIINTQDPSYYSYDNIMNLILSMPLQIKKINRRFFPRTNHWIHDDQIDDDISDESIKRRTDIFNKISSVEYPAQRSPEWYAQRDQKITASDIGLCLGDDHHNMIHFFLVKKFRETFSNNVHTYHGKKLETIATMIYEYRMNVTVNEFGLCHHPKYSFLGASPDGIVSHYKKDGKHKTNLVGRMLEIKCPTKRKIKITGKEKGDICPAYYWDQVQIQLETCDLDECDFWQCSIREYDNEEEFIKDTNIDEPFRSLKNNQEKGCLIQILPTNKFIKHIPGENTEDYNKLVWGDAKFIYPDSIEMSPYDCKIWLENTINNLSNTHPGYTYDRSIYWNLTFSHCQLIKRNRDWFKESIGTLDKMWSRVVFIRNNPRCKKIFLDYYDFYMHECQGPDAWKNEYHDKKHKKDKFMLDLVDTMMDKYNKYKDDYNKFDKYLKTLEDNLEDIKS